MKKPISGSMRTVLWTALLLALPVTVQGVIERMYSLREVLDECTQVLTGKIQKVDRKNRIVVASMERALKGAAEYGRVQINMNVGQMLEGKYCTELFREGDPFVLFYCRKENEIAALGHTSDLWFQLHANHESDTSRVWWQFTHIEIYMGRTFNGTTPDLLRLVDDVLAGRKKPPAPDPQVKKFDLARPPRRGASREVADRDGKPAVLIPEHAVWRYLKGKAEPCPAGDHAAWTSSGFDDSRWESGHGSFGYGDAPHGTLLEDMRKTETQEGYSSVYLRDTFEVPDPALVRGLSFGIDYDDGFILWLNGKRALEANAPLGDPAHDSLAAGSHESGVYENFTLEEPQRFLIKGKNVVAVQAFNRELTSSDLRIDLEATARVISPRRGGAFRQVFSLEAPPGVEVRGISWADVDQDGRLDALFCRRSGNVLLLNREAGWTAAAGDLGYEEGSRAAGWADYDGDGRADLLTSGFRVLRGAAGKAGSARLPVPEARNPEGAGWIDCDGDGLPDALITNGRHGILLYRNTGAEPDRFLDASAAAGLGAAGLGKGNGDFVAFADFDGDGYTDFLYNLGGGVLARNTGGSFVAEARAGIELPGGDAWKRGVAFADYDNDDDLDLFVPSPEKPRLYRNNNDGTFTDVLERAGDLAECSAQSFSCAWGDVNHDGFLDLLVCYAAEPARLYLGDGRGRFRAGDDLLPPAWPPAQAASFADVDGDGDLDLAVNLDSGVAVALNELPKDRRHGAVRVQVLARKGLVGAVVRAYDPGWRRLGMRQLALAEGCGGQGPPEGHLALPLGKCQVTVCLSDGRFARKTVDVTEKGLTLTFREEDLED